MTTNSNSVFTQPQRNPIFAELSTLFPPNIQKQRTLILCDIFMLSPVFF